MVNFAITFWTSVTINASVRIAKMNMDVGEVTKKELLFLLLYIGLSFLTYFFFLCQIGDMSLQPESSPTLKSQRSNGFWKVISMPSNGSLNLRIPFEVNGRLYLIANTLGTSGIASLGTYLTI